MDDVVAPGPDRVPRRSDKTLQAEVDGDLVLLNGADLGYFGTDGDGGEIWSLVDGERTVADIVAELEGRYAAGPGVIEGETTTFLEALHAAGLITY